MKVKELIRKAAAQFTESDSATLDAQLLLAEVLGKDRTWLMTWDDAEVSAGQQAKFSELVARRASGEPIAYILGRREFWGVELACDSSTLIPRPETELLVEKALELDLPKNARVLDLGTGTGAIALALASDRPQWQILAVDASEGAVALARRNQQELNVTNVDLIQSNWFAALSDSIRFDLIASNPPYIDPVSPYLNEGDVRAEPKTALVSDNKGMADIQYICQQAPRHLNKGGLLMFEHGFDQQAAAAVCLAERGFAEIQCFKDLAGLPRVSLGRFA